MISFDNSYARLGEEFFARAVPAVPPRPRLLALNRPLAAALGLNAGWLESPAGLGLLSGASLPPEVEPMALAYAGHQFGNFVPQLGDGRALLLGEALAPDGRRFDLQLKGSGRTPFSRSGDGRAALGPVLREYIVAEAMAALGIPTTRALAAVATGEAVQRETPLPGAVLVRVAASHIRVGTFQYFAAQGDLAALRRLADHAIQRHYPTAAEAENPVAALLQQVAIAQAKLIAGWLSVGFIHGVMNTDNMSIAGETIDYGPCAFMDGYDPGQVFSSIDWQGRYAYANQPQIGLWNLTRLAEALLPLLAAEQEASVAVAEDALGVYAPTFDAAWQAALRRKLGLDAADAALAADWLALLGANGADFTLAFRHLAEAALGDAAPLAAIVHDGAALADWLARWQAADPRPPAVRAAALRAANPLIIPRNHRIEAAIAAAVNDEDFRPFERLLAAVTQPFDPAADLLDHAAPPAPHERVQATFCGT